MGHQAGARTRQRLKERSVTIRTSACHGPPSPHHLAFRFVARGGAPRPSIANLAGRRALRGTSGSRIIWSGVVIQKGAGPTSTQPTTIPIASLASRSSSPIARRPPRSPGARSSGPVGQDAGSCAPASATSCSTAMSGCRSRLDTMERASRITSIGCSSCAQDQRRSQTLGRSRAADRLAGQNEKSACWSARRRAIPD